MKNILCTRAKVTIFFFGVLVVFLVVAEGSITADKFCSHLLSSLSLLRWIAK